MLSYDVYVKKLLIEKMIDSFRDATTVEEKNVKDSKNKGYAVEEALRYCAGSEQIYKEVLHTALVEGKQKECFG